MHVGETTPRSSGGGSGGGSTSTSVAPSGLTIYLRIRTFGANANCQNSLRFDGNLQTVANGATSGQTTFDSGLHPANISPSQYQEGGFTVYYCVASHNEYGLKAGNWSIGFGETTNSNKTQCMTVIPLAAAAYGRVNFTYDTAGCTTGLTYP